MGTKEGEGGVWGQPTPFNLKRGLGVPMTPFCSIFSEQIPQNKETVERGRGGGRTSPPLGVGGGEWSVVSPTSFGPRGLDTCPPPSQWSGDPPPGGTELLKKGAWDEPEERAAEGQDCGHGGGHGSREGSGPGPHGNEVRGEESSA